MLLLVDSGSTHTFVNTAFAQPIGAATTSISPITVRVANGQQLTCTEVVPQLKWHTHGHEFCTDMRVLDLGVYDAVLGVDWLACHSPMQCDWGLKTMRFTKHGNTILLAGVRTED